MPSGKYIRTEEHKIKISKIAKERGFGKWMIGKHPSKETREKISNKLKGIKLSEETRKKISIALQGKHSNMTGKHHSEETKNKMSESRKKYIKIYGHPKGMLGKHFSKEAKLKIGQKNKEHWQNPDYRKKIILRCLNIKKPTSLEIRVEKLISELNFPYRYCGSGKGICILNGRPPDFININGEKKVIEANGIYWHGVLTGRNTKEQEEERLNKIYEQVGFKCLHLWEDENEDVWKEKLLKF